MEVANKDLDGNVHQHVLSYSIDIMHMEISSIISKFTLNDVKTRKVPTETSLLKEEDRQDTLTDEGQDGR